MSKKKKPTGDQEPIEIARSILEGDSWSETDDEPSEEDGEELPRPTSSEIASLVAKIFGDPPPEDEDQSEN